MCCGVSFRPDQDAANATPPEDPSFPPPPWLDTEEELRRWWLSVWAAKELFGDVDPGAVWMAARAIYSSELRTD